jgi:metal-dependent amidase/aminoacylase/carboxypeptidase family protein
MDAVADDELTGGEFASRVSGAAHLYGHDLHTTIGVGTAETLSQLRQRFCGRVVFVFQPAEETLEGARAMIDAGVLDRVAPVEIYALHCPAGRRFRGDARRWTARYRCRAHRRIRAERRTNRRSAC